jgi:hypothetical protein
MVFGARVILLGLPGYLAPPHRLSCCHGSRYNSSFAAIGASKSPNSVQNSTFQSRRRVWRGVPVIRTSLIPWYLPPPWPIDIIASGELYMYFPFLLYSYLNLFNLYNIEIPANEIGFNENWRRYTWFNFKECDCGREEAFKQHEVLEHISIGTVRRKHIIMICGRPFLIVCIDSSTKALGGDAGPVCSLAENVGIGFDFEPGWLQLHPF